jgi:malate dehydrogenase (oxaloacetate-decarboxylating)(NADP+)
VKVVLNGPGAAGIATLGLMKAMGVKHENVIAVDRKGVLYRGRPEDMNQWKSAHAIDTDKRTLADAWRAPTCSSGSAPRGA